MAKTRKKKLAQKKQRLQQSRLSNKLALSEFQEALIENEKVADEYDSSLSAISAMKPKMYGHNPNMIVVGDEQSFDRPIQRYRDHGKSTVDESILKTRNALMANQPCSVRTMDDTPYMQNERGEWVPAIPLPFYGLKKRCSCNASFWFLKNYRAHYALHHIVTGLYPL